MAKKKKIALVLVIAVVLLAVVVATRPATFHVERSATIHASPATLYGHVVDFHAWPAWSPWAKLDPAMQVSYSGTTGTAGSAYSWKGNDKVGEGRMTLTEVKPSARIAQRLEFLRPFAATNAVLFVFVPEGDSTRVTWSMDGHNNFMAKAASLAMDMDKLVGGDFERGLANLKSVAEAAPGETPAAAR
jgi:hypothetical protein